MPEHWTHLSPLAVTVRVHAETRQDDQAHTHLHLSLMVEHGTDTWTVDEILPVAVTLPLLDAALERCKAELRERWIASQKAQGRDYARPWEQIS